MSTSSGRTMLPSGKMSDYVPFASWVGELIFAARLSRQV